MSALPQSLVEQRCWHHPAREAVVRCPECKRFYCRECVTEHLGRMICASCVAQASRAGLPTGRLRNLAWTGLAFGGFLLAWLIFYYVGVILARIPSDFFGGPA
jgi:hypothetical protein